MVAPTWRFQPLTFRLAMSVPTWVPAKVSLFSVLQVISPGTGRPTACTLDVMVASLGAHFAANRTAPDATAFLTGRGIWRRADESGRLGQKRRIGGVDRRNQGAAGAARSERQKGRDAGGASDRQSAGAGAIRHRGRRGQQRHERGTGQGPTATAHA